MVVTIVGAIIAIILAVLGIGALVSVLEVFKFIGVGLVIVLSYFYLNSFFMKKFKINENVSIVISLLFSVMLGILVYKSWWAIVVLLIVYGIFQFILGYYSDFFDIFKQYKKLKNNKKNGKGGKK